MNKVVDGQAYRTTQSDLAIIAQAKSTAKQTLIKGVALLAFGTVVTSLSYSFAKPGSTYLVTTGSFLAGIYYTLKGAYFYLNPDYLLEKSGIKRPTTFDPEVEQSELSEEDNQEKYDDPWTSW